MPSVSKDTYCPFLWEEVYIDPKGDVFGCCHRKPGLIGNIQNGKLKDIYNNSIMQQLRQDSLDGKLPCYERCTILDKESKAPRKTTFNYYSDLKKLKIEFGELCNINCVMCWQDHKSRTVLDHKIVIENVDLEPFDSVDIQGGEPLAMPEAKAFYEYAASQNKRPFFMTNGLLINDEWAEKIVLNSAAIYISLNAATAKTHEIVNRGSKWDTVMKNIKKLQDARRRHGAAFKITGHMTIVLENVQEIALFISHFPEFGFDQIGFGYDQKVPEYLKAQPFLKISLKRDVIKALRTTKDPSLVDLKRLKMLELV